MVTKLSVGQFEAEIWEEVLHIMSDKGLFVFPTHEKVWCRNKSKHLELNSEHPIVSECRGCHSKSSDSEKVGGLQKTFSCVYLLR